MDTFTKAILDYDPKIISLRWDVEISPKPYEFELTTKISGIEGVGRGAELGNEDLALRKALGESIERIIVKYNSLPTSNGVAAHFVMQDAIRNSQLEYFERFIFLLNFYTGQLDGLDLGRSEFLREYGLAHAGICLNLKSTLIGKGEVNCETAYVVMSVCILRGGVVVGLGTKNSLQAATMKAEMEVAQLANYFIANCSKKMTLQEFSKKSAHSFEDHGLLAMCPNYFQKVNHAFLKKIPSVMYNMNVNMLSTKLKCPAEIDGLGMHFYKSEIKTGFDFFCGYPNPEFVASINKLAKRLNLEIDEQLINLPHPIA